jgi:hypothetical protein
MMTAGDGFGSLRRRDAAPLPVLTAPARHTVSGIMRVMDEAESA